MNKLIVVSNRTAAATGLRAGGLAVAVSDALQKSGGTWIGWSGEVVDERPRGVSVIRDEGVQYILSDLSQEEFDGYYLQFANRMIWPDFHYRVDLAHYDNDTFEIYRAVNQRFAEIVAQEATPGDLVWVHDYHFLLMGDALRQAGWDGPTGYFLHIPFPSPELFRALPQHNRIARSLSYFDVIGFQSERDAANFHRYMIEECAAVDLGDGRLRAFGRTFSARAYPIGIDPVTIEKAAESELARAATEKISRFLGGGRSLVIGVDRMDYSKGLPERFEAVGQLFDQFEQVRGKVSFTQIAPPSRSMVEEYKNLRKELDRLAGRINGDYGDLDWIPIRYLARAYQRDELAGLFRVADVALVTPLRDGMNLVAKEYVAAQDPEDPGVLVLSEFAGAAEQMTEALIINPHDRGQVAEAIYRALTMSLTERKDRWQALSETVKAQDISWWSDRFLTDLRACGLPAATAVAS
ncbi:MAG: trehalose-6-phosphate synthase [Hyphomonadaceae bacterium]